MGRHAVRSHPLNTSPVPTPSDPQQAIPALIGRPLVALLPFVPCGFDPSLRVLGNRIADRLREQLAADPMMGAILISSDFLAAAPPHAVELICRELRVGHLISGKCHGTGSEPSLYVELTDTRDWHVRWSEFYRFNAGAFLADDGHAIASMVRQLRDAFAERRWR
jgi:TolB-like protein